MTLDCGWALEMQLTIFSETQTLMVVEHHWAVDYNKRGKRIDLHVHPTAGFADAGVWKSMATGIVLENCWFVNN